MRLKNKKLLIGLGTSFIGLSIVGGLTTFYFLTPSIKRISKEGIYLIRSNSNLSVNGYKHDMSATSGAPESNSSSVLLSSDLIHLKSEGKLKLSTDPQTGASKIESPSYQSLQFGVGEAIVVQLKSDSSNEIIELIFDSDDSTYPKLDPSSSAIVVDKVSNNPRSINNQKIFLNLLSKGSINQKINSIDDLKESMIVENGEWYIKNVGLMVNESAKWVDSNGNETKYNITPDDIWYSFMRTKLFDIDYRLKNGGSEELDSYFIKRYNTITRFQKDGRFTNEYLYEFFDLDSTQNYKNRDSSGKLTRDSVIKKVKSSEPRFKDREAYFFTSLENTKHTSGFISIINKFLTNNLQLSLAPSQYIKELAQNEELNTVNGTKITSDARDFGIYTYGARKENTLFASPYIPTIETEGREIFVYNKHYANKKWVDSIEKGETINNGKKVKGINKIIFDYSGGIDTSTYNSQVFNGYLSGLVSEIKYSDLTPTQKEQIYGVGTTEQIYKNAENNGLQYSRELNTSKLVQRTLVQSNPSGGGGYLFNDEYAKLVFGNDTKSLSSGEAITSDAFFKGDGLEFRLLVQASINWDAFIKDAWGGQKIMWLNNAAQDAKFSSFDPSSKTPYDYYEEVNTLQFFDSITNPNIPKLESVLPSEMKKHTSDYIADAKKQIQSPKFDLIKQNMKALLDRKGISQSSKISWQVVYPYADQDIIKISVLEKLVEAIKSLDPRLDPKVTVPKDRDEMIKLINTNKGISDFNGWSYDYEGIGSYLAAFSNGIGVTLINAFSLYSSENPDERIQYLQSLYPEFTKLSKFVKEKTDEEMKNKGIEEKFWVKNWTNITNGQNQDIKKWFKSQTSDKYDPTVSLAKLMKEYESKGSSNEEYAQLIKELNSIKGVSMEADSAISDPNRSNLILALKEYVIPVTKYGIKYFMDYRYDLEV